MDEKVAATGAVARDGSSFRGASCKIYKGITEPLVVEALALRDAFAYAVKQGFQCVVFEVDCAVLIQHWNNRALDQSVLKPVLDEISELGSSFLSFSIVFARREANQAAHCTAKFASLQLVSNSREAEPPAFLEHSLEADCNPVLVN